MFTCEVRGKGSPKMFFVLMKPIRGDDSYIKSTVLHQLLLGMKMINYFINRELIDLIECLAIN